MTEVFVGVIVVAIIGNAAEHSTAVLMALKNKMDLAVNIAVGSSIQIALFVAPVLVFLSYADRPAARWTCSSRRSRCSRSCSSVCIDGDSSRRTASRTGWRACCCWRSTGFSGIAFYFLPV